MSDVLEQIRDLRPSVPSPSRQLVTTERDRLMSFIEREQPGDPASPQRWRKRWLVPAVTVVALTAAAAGWALSTNVEQTTGVTCVAWEALAPDGMSYGIVANSGDPVADCTDHWRRVQGIEPPQLVAYENPGLGVHVVAAGAEIPDDWTLLDAGFQQDDRVIELESALADHGDGLNARCYTPEDAVDEAENTLDRLGLADWGVRIEREGGSGSGSCAKSRLDPAAREVVIILWSGPPAAEPMPYERLADSVHAEVDGQCLTRDEAVDAIRRIAADLGISEEAGTLEIRSLPDDSATCSRTDTVVGGSIIVWVRGA